MTNGRTAPINTASKTFTIAADYYYRPAGRARRGRAVQLVNMHKSYCFNFVVVAIIHVVELNLVIASIAEIFDLSCNAIKYIPNVFFNFLQNNNSYC